MNFENILALRNLVTLPAPQFPIYQHSLLKLTPVLLGASTVRKHIHAILYQKKKKDIWIFTNELAKLPE